MRVWWGLGWEWWLGLGVDVGGVDNDVTRKKRKM